MATRFCRYDLRTTDVERARAFYSRIAGADFWSDTLGIGPLSEQARARGALPHWLGHLAVDSVSTTAQRFLARGATPLGPPPPSECAPRVLRDPFGAVVALAPPHRTLDHQRVAWHMLHVVNETDAFPVYTEIFGWTPAGARAFGEGQREQMFAWDADAAPAGSVANTAASPGVHPHWMFFFACDSLDESLRTVRELGGLTLPVVERPDGSRLAACEDPQRAAFGLYQATTFPC
jgi:predicted enzyme related to lactoylglutathione lyase